MSHEKAGGRFPVRGGVAPASSGRDSRPPATPSGHRGRSLPPWEALRPVRFSGTWHFSNPALAVFPGGNEEWQPLTGRCSGKNAWHGHCAKSPSETQNPNPIPPNRSSLPEDPPFPRAQAEGTQPKPSPCALRPFNGPNDGPISVLRGKASLPGARRPTWPGRPAPPSWPLTRRRPPRGTSRQASSGRRPDGRATGRPPSGR